MNEPHWANQAHRLLILPNPLIGERTEKETCMEEAQYSHHSNSGHFHTSLKTDGGLLILKIKSQKITFHVGVKYEFRLWL